MLEAQSIAAAIKQICAEKNLSEDAVIETIQSALAAAYRKDFGQKNQNIKVEFDLKTGDFNVFDIKNVVENLPEDYFEKLEEKRLQRMQEFEEGTERDAYVEKEESKEDLEEEIKFNPKTDMELKEAKAVKKGAKIGDEIKTELEVPSDFGRMAAQTAKQVIIQKLREAERDVLFDEYEEKKGQILTGIIQKREGRNVLVDLGKVTGILPPQEQVQTDNYKLGERIKVYVLSVEKGTKGPELHLSRAHEDILRQLFFLEIPEIASKAIEIKGIAREAGSRSKVAVYTEDPNIDPIGSCVGQRGARIQTIIGELGGEKIDIINWSENPGEYISNALSPANVLKIEIDEKNKSALASVKAEQLSLAIGKQGQNVRLAAKLTGWKININEFETGKEVVAEEAAKDNNEEKSLPKEKAIKSDVKIEGEPAKKEKKSKTKKTKKEPASAELSSATVGEKE